MRIPLSTRLLACAGFVKQGDRVADIGCDHGYLSIHLLINGIARSVIASDVAEGPLQSAMNNARKIGVQENISFYLSDGVRNIPRDFDTLICAGMGGDTMIHILESAPWLQSESYRLILQCQSKRPELRKWLYEQGFAIRQETLAKDGKFIYTIMEVVWEPGGSFAPVDAYLSPALLRSGSPLLPDFYRRKMHGLTLSVEGMRRSGDPRLPHYEAIQEAMEQLAEADGIAVSIPGPSFDTVYDTQIHDFGFDIQTFHYIRFFPDGTLLCVMAPNFKYSYDESYQSKTYVQNELLIPGKAPSGEEFGVMTGTWWIRRSGFFYKILWKEGIWEEGSGYFYPSGLEVNYRNHFYHVKGTNRCYTTNY